MKVKIYKRPSAFMPTLGSENAAAYDVRADLPSLMDDIQYSCNVEQDMYGSLPENKPIPNQYVIHPGGWLLVPTGLYVSIPKGFEIQVRPRSGLAAKYGITIINSPGTIDADYRGEIGVILQNNGFEAFKVKSGDRIGQLALRKVYSITWKDVDNYSGLDETDRGKGGFGSTGK